MRIGFACAYTPLHLVDAAGCVPYRVLPTTAAQDRAGRMLHDNMCPHVKRILDRAMDGDLPGLGGMILMNSCDAMRRLADAWRQVRPDDRVLLVDLPVTRGPGSERWLAGELGRVVRALADWTGRPVGDEQVLEAVVRYDELADLLARLAERRALGTLPGGSAGLQRIVENVSRSSLGESIVACRIVLEQPGSDEVPSGVPTHLVGNVLPDPAAIELVERSGARIVSDDLCTGSRLMHRVGIRNGEGVMDAIARSIMERPACARTITPGSPGRLGADVVEGARRHGARAVIAHVAKFCDPHLGRMPAVRRACDEADLPLLVLEGDCTMRSLGQHATRIEAFMEMLG